jgi:hypothetical protein
MMVIEIPDLFFFIIIIFNNITANINIIIYLLFILILDKLGISIILYVYKTKLYII